MVNLFSLAGRIALITGASSGIGCTIGQALAQAGASDFINGQTIYVDGGLVSVIWGC